MIDCDVLDGIDNGYITYMDGTVLNSMAFYFCNTGYMFDPGANTMRLCMNTGLWDGMEPTCNSKIAPPPCVHTVCHAVMPYDAQH